MQRVYKKLHEVSDLILVSDLLLYRGTSWMSKLIQVAGRSEYSHAAKADRLVNNRNGTLCVIETREWKGAGITTIEKHARDYAGRIDVFRTNPDNIPGYSRDASAAFIRRYEMACYGYWAVWKAALLYLPGVRLLVKPNYDADSGTPDRAPFCSQLCAMADRFGGGIDPVPHLADHYTLPGDLARSRFYDYRFTLTGP